MVDIFTIRANALGFFVLARTYTLLAAVLVAASFFGKRGRKPYMFLFT
jgi:hypothetical protein